MIMVAGVISTDFSRPETVWLQALLKCEPIPRQRYSGTVHSRKVTPEVAGSVSCRDVFGIHYNRIALTRKNILRTTSFCTYKGNCYVKVLPVKTWIWPACQMPSLKQRSRTARKKVVRYWKVWHNSVDGRSQRTIVLFLLKDETKLQSIEMKYL